MYGITSDAGMRLETRKKQRSFLGRIVTARLPIDIVYPSQRRYLEGLVGNAGSVTRGPGNAER